MEALLTYTAIALVIRALGGARHKARRSTVQVGSAHYRGQHQAPDRESGSPLYDVSLNGIYPKDFYSSPWTWYSDGNDNYLKLFQVAQGKFERPLSSIRIYRALPKGIPGTGKTLINRGDWVAISRAYAKDHGESALKGDYKIVSKSVHAADIYTAGDSLNEWGYDPLSNSELLELRRKYKIKRLKRSLRYDPSNEKLQAMLERLTGSRYTV